MNNPFLEILIILLLLIANGVLAMSEIAVVSARRARLQQAAERGDARARAALALAADPSPFLATVQIGITLVGVLAGAFGGATIAREIAAWLNGVPALAPYGETIGVAVVVLVITYFSLVIGELVPKRLALNSPERIAAFVAAPVQALSRLTSPVVRLLSASTDVVIRLLGIRLVEEPTVTSDEVRVLVAQGAAAGVFEESEQDMIESVLRLDERRVGAIMTPRTQIVWLDIAESADEVRRKIVACQHSRFPVARDSLDRVLGIVRARDLLARTMAGEPFDLQALLHPALFIPETMSALRVLELFKQNATHLALVTDEYGAIEGMVTHNDILETIVGAIPAAGEPAEPQATARGDGSWLVDGLLHIDRLKDIFDLDALPGEEQGQYQTVGGFILSRTRSIPEAGERFVWDRLQFEVVDMDGRRVDKVLITPLSSNGDTLTTE